MGESDELGTAEWMYVNNPINTVSYISLLHVYPMLLTYSSTVLILELSSIMLYKELPSITQVNHKRKLTFVISISKLLSNEKCRQT